jgi:hypothetical protein
MQVAIGLLWRMFAVVLALFSLSAAASSASTGGLGQHEIDKCYICHVDKKESHAKGPHANTNCLICHDGSREHVKDLDDLNPSLTRYAPISLFYPHRHPASPAKPLDFG